MDPNSVIVNALVSALTKLAEPAVRDMYNKLKGLIIARFGSKPDVESTLQRFEQRPEVWREPLRQVLEEVNAGRDSEIVNLAEAISQQTETGGVSITAVQFGRDNVSIPIGRMEGGTVTGKVEQPGEKKNE